MKLGSVQELRKQHCRSYLRCFNNNDFQTYFSLVNTCIFSACQNSAKVILELSQIKYML